MVISLTNMSFYYTDYYNMVFDKLNLIFSTDWKIGLIGRNGSGKTTLLKLLCGVLKPTEGSISTPVEVSYFPYINETHYTQTIDVIKEYAGNYKSMEDEMNLLLKSKDSVECERYFSIQQQYIEQGGYEIESRILREINAMKLRADILTRSYETLSGGEKTKIMIISLFLRQNHFIVMDEPTNHLDAFGKQVVSDYLSSKKGFIVVSHDVDFVDEITDHIVYVGKKGVQIEKGTYSSFKANKEKGEKFELQIKDKLEREILSLEKRANLNRNWATVANKQKYSIKSSARTNGSKSYMAQAKRAEMRIKQNIDGKRALLKDVDQSIRLRIEQEKLVNDDWLIWVNGLSFGYQKKQELFHDFNLTVYPRERIWIRGANGCGKSTLLRILSGEIVTPNVYYSNNCKIAFAGQEPLWKKGTISENLLDGKVGCLQQVISIAECFGIEKETLGRPLQAFSSGELKKIDIARVLSMKNQVIFLDEPLNYMDEIFKEQFKRAILQYQPTIVFVEHDEEFGDNVATQIIQLY